MKPGGSEFPAFLFEHPSEADAGMHMPDEAAQGTPQFHPEEFVYHYLDQIDLAEDMKKEALGLQDIPSANVPYDNRMGYQDDDYEVANQFLGSDDGPGMSTKNQKYQESIYEYPEHEDEKDFFEFLSSGKTKMLKKLQDLKQQIHDKQSQLEIDGLIKNALGPGATVPVPSMMKMEFDPSSHRSVSTPTSLPQADYSKAYNDFMAQFAPPGQKPPAGFPEKVSETIRKYSPGTSEFNISSLRKELENIMSALPGFGYSPTSYSNKSALDRLMAALDMSDRLGTSEPEPETSQQVPSTTQRTQVKRPAPLIRPWSGAKNNDTLETQVLLNIGRDEKTQIKEDGYWGKNTEDAWNQYWSKKGQVAPQVETAEAALIAIRGAFNSGAPEVPATTETTPGTEQSPEKPIAAQVMITGADVSAAIAALSAGQGGLTIQSGEGAGEVLSDEKLAARTNRYIHSLRKGGETDIIKLLAEQLKDKPKPEDMTGLGGIVFMALEQAALGTSRATRREEHYQNKAKRRIEKQRNQRREEMLRTRRPLGG